MTRKLSLIANKIKTNRIEIVFQILTVFIVPVLLIQTKILPINSRITVLIVTVSLFVILLLKENWTIKMLNMDKKSFKKFLFPYFLFTLIGVIVITSLGEKMGREEIAKWWTNSHFLYLFFVVSIFQEVAYRGYLVPALRKFIPKTALIIFINAILFSYMHSIFPNPEINLPLAFIGGLGFAAMYIEYPSLPLIIASHAVLNFTAVLYGFFMIH